MKKFLYYLGKIRATTFLGHALANEYIKMGNDDDAKRIVYWYSNKFARLYWIFTIY